MTAPRRARGEPLRCRWLFGFNLPLYAVGLPIAPQAVATDGLLDICTFARGSLWSVLRDICGMCCGAVIRRCPTPPYLAAGDFGWKRAGGPTSPTNSTVTSRARCRSTSRCCRGNCGYSCRADSRAIGLRAARGRRDNRWNQYAGRGPGGGMNMTRAGSVAPVLNYPAKIGTYRCGAGEKLLVVAGPCVIESEALTLRIAERLAAATRDLPVQLVFKASFDKANRTSLDAYRGPGIDEGLRILQRVGRGDRPAGDDRHSRIDAGGGGRARFATCLQIPAFLARQTDLLAAAAATGRAVHVKKGQFMAPLGHAARGG